MIALLRNLHPGQTAHIVGKGPSLRYLRAEHFKAGPVLAINEAVYVVQELGIPNPLYNMNKDGCRGYRPGHTCKLADPRADVTLILQYILSEHCLPEHARRVVVTHEELGFSSVIVMSIRMCIAVVKIMGCSAIRFLCCDALTTPDTRTYIVAKDSAEPTQSAASYRHVRPRVLADVEHIPHEFVLPEAYETSAARTD